MPKVLIIAEKPSVALNLACALIDPKLKKASCYRGRGHGGVDFTIVNGIGHLFTHASPRTYNPAKDDWDPANLPLLPHAGWKFEYVAAKPDIEPILDLLKGEIGTHAGHEVVNACDAGREGELIFREITKVYQPTPTTKLSRMWMKAQTAEALVATFNGRDALSKYDPLGEAAFSRADADWLIGMNETVLASKTLPRGVGEWKLWSVGRVQTPLLAIIDQRDDDILNFRSEPFWEVQAVFSGVTAKADLDAYASSPAASELLGVTKDPEENTRKVFWVEDKAKAFAQSAKSPGEYLCQEKQSVKTARTPLPYDLKEMQKLFSNQHKLTAKETLNILQKLYEQKLISYPRTEYRYIEEGEKEQVYNALLSVMGRLKELRPNLNICTQPLMSREVAFSSRAFNSKEIGDHGGLVPTGSLAGIESLAGHELFAYLTIVQQTLMALDSPATYSVCQRVWTQQKASGPYAPAVFRAQGEVPRTAGFTRWLRKNPDDASKELPPIAPGLVPVDSVKVKSLKTSAKKPFTDASLLVAMELAGKSFDDDIDPVKLEALILAMKDRGLGTAATRADHIENLVRKGYVARQKDTLRTTENGRMLVREIRSRHPDVLSPRLTAEWEMLLKQMESGTAPLTRIQFLDKLLDEFLRVKDIFMANSTRSAATGKTSNITEGTAVAGAVCPKSKKPILDKGDAWMAPGWPKTLFWKTAFGKEWEIATYLEFLTAAAEKKPYRIIGVRKDKTTYEAEITIDAESNRVEFYKPKPIALKEHVCPKSKKPLRDCGKYFESEGWPGLWLPKNVYGRMFEAKDWISILNGWFKDAPIFVSRLISKAKGTSYNAIIVYDKEKNRISLQL